MFLTKQLLDSSNSSWAENIKLFFNCKNRLSTHGIIDFVVGLFNWDINGFFNYMSWYSSYLCVCLLSPPGIKTLFFLFRQQLPTTIEIDSSMDVVTSNGSLTHRANWHSTGFQWKSLVNALKKLLYVVLWVVLTNSPLKDLKEVNFDLKQLLDWSPKVANAKLDQENIIRKYNSMSSLIEYQITADFL